MNQDANNLSAAPQLLRALVSQWSDLSDASEHGPYAQQILKRVAHDIESHSVNRALASDCQKLMTDIKAQVTCSYSLTQATLRNAQDFAHALSAALFALRATQVKGEKDQTEALWRRAEDISHQLRNAMKLPTADSKHREEQSTDVLSSAALQRYLRSQSALSKHCAVEDLEVLHGGRSKQTTLATLSNHPQWKSIVLRQDVPNGMVDTVGGSTGVKNEYPMLKTAFDAGIAVPEPLWLEPISSELGPPFLITRRVSGQAPGNWLGFSNASSVNTVNVVRELARQLGRLHSLDVRHLQTQCAGSFSASMQREIEYRWSKWQETRTTVSPLMDCAFARLYNVFNNAGESPQYPVLVHGDVLPHNLLAEQGKLTALLDWEFSHLGDPAEDLAYCRQAVSAVVPWAEFMTLYCSAGGKPISEYRLAVFGLFALLRNSALLANAERLYAEGKIPDFSTGAIAYTSLPMMEELIASQLQTLNQLEGQFRHEY